MIVLKIEDFKIPDNATIVSTYFMVARDVNFTDIVANIENDTVNLLLRRINIEVTEGQIYYAKTRFVYNTGMSQWSKTVSARATDTNELTMVIHTPVKVENPEISFKFSELTQPSSLMGVALVYQQPNIREIVKHVSWIIEDMSGKTVFESLEDTNNIDGIVITKALDRNQCFVIKVKITTTTDDSSGFSSQVFYTGHDSNLELYIDATAIDINSDDYLFNFYKLQNFKQLKLDVYDKDYNFIRTVYFTSNNIVASDIFLDTLTQDTESQLYYLRFVATYDTGDVGEPTVITAYRHYGEKTCLPANLPMILGCNG
jgi:hypothetical protein